MDRLLTAIMGRPAKYLLKLADKRNHTMKTPSPEETALITAVIEAKLAEPWNALPPSHRKRWVEHVLEAKKIDTQARRTEKLLDALRKPG